MIEADVQAAGVQAVVHVVAAESRQGADRLAVLAAAIGEQEHPLVRVEFDAEGGGEHVQAVGPIEQIPIHAFIAQVPGQRLRSHPVTAVFDLRAEAVQAVGAGVAQTQVEVVGRRLNQALETMAGAEYGGIGNQPLKQFGVLAEQAVVAVGEEQMAAGPERIEGLLRIAARPLLHAHEGEGLAQIGAALLVVGELVERLEVGQTAHRLARRVDRSGRSKQIGANHRGHEVGQRILVIQFAGAGQFILRLLDLAHLVIGHGGVDVHPGVAGFHDASLEEGLQRLSGVATLEFEHAQSGQGDKIRRIGGQGRAVSGFGSGEFVGQRFQCAQFALVANARRVQGQCLLQIGTSLANVFPFAIGGTASIPGPVVVWFEADGQIVGGIGRRRATFAARDVGARQPGVIAGEIRIDGCFRGRGSLVGAVRQQKQAGLLGIKPGGVREALQALLDLLQSRLRPSLIGGQVG